MIQRLQDILEAMEESLEAMEGSFLDKEIDKFYRINSHLDKQLEKAYKLNKSDSDYEKLEEINNKRLGLLKYF